MISASQISDFLDCPRKWAYKTLERLPTCPNASAQLGIATHGELDDYFKGKVTIVQNDFARALLPLLPEPPMPSEVRWTKGGFVGVVDLVDEPNHTVYDHKTTSHLRWARTPDELLWDPQGILYSWWADWPVVKLRWNYVQTKGALRTLPVVQEMTRAHVDHAMGAIFAVAEEMGRTTPENARKDYTACNKYGGCLFRSTCHANDPQASARSLFGWTP